MNLRESITSRTPVRGTFVGIPAPMAVEIVAGAGPDFVCIDCEHSPIGPETLVNMIRAADVCGVPALVRMPSADGPAIAAALDAGAAGILVPHVSDAATAARAVEAARYPGVGSRGAGPGRAARYCRDIPGYIGRARQDTVVAVQIETLAAVDAVAEIVAVPGLDLVFIGPGDLGVDLRAATGRTETLDELMQTVVAAADAAGTPVGIFTASRASSADWLKKLAFVIEGSDAMFLTQASDAAFAPL